MAIRRGSKREALGVRYRRFDMAILAVFSLGVVPSRALVHPSRSHNFAARWAPTSPYVSQSRLPRYDQKSTCTRSICLVTTMTDGCDDYKEKGLFRCPECIKSAISKFKSRPSAYLLIPAVAAFVGWFTNYLAVQMIFYPIKYRGIPLWRWDEQPLGLIGWQGIVP